MRSCEQTACPGTAPDSRGRIAGRNRRSTLGWRDAGQGSDAVTSTRPNGTQRIATAIAALLVVTLVALLVVLARSKHLLVIGDSLADAARDDLVHMGAAAGDQTTVDAVPGAELGERMPVIEKDRTHRSGPLVVELGTNDVGHGVLQPEVFRRIDDAVALLTDASCVVFVDVGVLNDLEQSASAFNQHLVEATAPHANMHVYDWAADYRQHPDWSLEGIHLKPDHVRDFAELVIGAVNANC